MNDDARPKKPGRRRWVLRGISILAGLMVLAAGIGCWIMIHMPGTSYRGELPEPDDRLTALADQLHADVAALAVDIGQRNVRNRPANLARAADWIEKQFAAAGCTARRQDYEVSGVTCSNLEVELPGTARHGEIILVGAHYDTVPGTAGADDNTSGVAATLALARSFAHRKMQRTLRFVAFVNEEPPYFQTEQMGSCVYARRCRQRGEHIAGMLSLEMLGCYSDAPGSQHYPPPFSLLYPSQGDFIAFVGNTSSRDLLRQAVGAFRGGEPFPCEGAVLPEAMPGVGFSDHWSFWQEGYAAIMVTDTAMFRYPYYHEPDDTIDKLDFARMARVVRGLEKVIAALAGGE
jgi:hypothetical protein